MSTETHQQDVLFWVEDSTELPEPVIQPRQYTRWELIAQALRERPGVWAAVHSPASVTLEQRTNAARNLAYGIIQGRKNGMDKGEYEAYAAKPNEDGKVVVYCRYVGLDSSD